MLKNFEIKTISVSPNNYGEKSDSIIDEDKNFYINPNLTKYKTTSDKANYFSYGKIKLSFFLIVNRELSYFTFI